MTIFRTVVYCWAMLWLVFAARAALEGKIEFGSKSDKYVWTGPFYKEPRP